MRKKIYLKIIELLVEGELIKHVDLWNENIQYITEEQAWSTPAVFVEFEPIIWMPFPGGVQEGTVTVRLHIITRCIEPTNDSSPYKDSALAYLDMLDSINSRIHGFSGDGFNTFTRKQSVTNHNHEELVESIETFSVHVIDASSSSEVQMIEAPRTVQIQL
ncbi:MAG: hypothetical protein LBF57_03380 [Holosporaceae bacterium]|jgi:hypothetical protein|nr:hypothetical protein [Holosporaceae bacterium]